MPARIQAPEVVSHPDFSGWSDSSARAVLQLMAESVAEMIGFEVAALSVVLDDQLVTMAYTGPDEFRDWVFHTDPVSVLDPVLARARQWGRFRFLPAEEQDGRLDGHWVITAPEPDDHPDAWRPMDVLLALLTDDDGRLRGVLSVDNPVSGRRPTEAQRRMLERYAAQAERAVITAFEREEMLQQIAHAETARRLIRSTATTAHASLEDLLSHAQKPLVEGFEASGSWIQVLEPGGHGRGRARRRDGEPVDLTSTVIELARRLAPRLWERQRVVVVTDGAQPAEADNVVLGPLLGETRRQLIALGLGSVLAVPLGAGAECVGFLALTRRTQDPPWSAVELDSALQIGHDLGAALVTARALESERSMVRELQDLHELRGQLITTLSHELRTPLTVISGNLELLGSLDLHPSADRYQQAMLRGTTRMQKVVDDLLLLSRVSTPQHRAVRETVDLGRVAAEVVDLVGSTARAKGLKLEVKIAPYDLEVSGDPVELDRMLSNLVSNAVKYTPEGGTISVWVYPQGDQVVVRVDDDGIGISYEDQRALFQPFFRTNNPEALRQPGSGLGLAIVAQIAERHRGSVEVGSRPGSGTTFTVLLPSA